MDVPKWCLVERYQAERYQVPKERELVPDTEMTEAGTRYRTASCWYLTPKGHAQVPGTNHHPNHQNPVFKN
ncbi:hypothetical protein [Halobacillus sp. BBL2006]|uniref:hypothetical protein n=1 Tax=Halobacillus sp. BBL2006 TaxID=1543706 RepID=UPI0012E03B5D|nr:hypothetical protein [Halobacillus sp. BBL2006]